MLKLKWFLYSIFHRFLLLLPRRSGYALAYFMGSLAYVFSRRGRSNVMSNLSVVMPETAGKERAKTARQVFINFAKYLTDFLTAERIDIEYIKDHVEFADLSVLLKAKEEGRGVILLTAHLGNWELGGGVLSICGHAVHAVALPHLDEKTNDLFNRQRRLMQMEVIPTGVAVKRCFSVLKQGKILALLGDKDFSGNGIETSIFSRRVILPRGPAFLSAKLDVPVIPAFILRREDDSYYLSVDDPVYPKKENGQMQSEEELTSLYAAAIERNIRKSPSQWFMFEQYFI